MKELSNQQQEKKLFREITFLIEQSHQHVVSQIQKEMVLLYWNIGKTLKETLFSNEESTYGKQVVKNLSFQLKAMYGSGFGERNLFYMIRFAETFPVLEEVPNELSWSHLRLIIYIDDELKRSFYAEMSRMEGWSVRILKDRIRSMLYERTALSRKPEKLIREELAALREENQLSEDLVFRDPYLLDFLGLEDSYSEKDLEDAILDKLSKFLLELGTDFAFLARQKRITVDNEDYCMDLLFYHRSLMALVVIDLKIDKFKPKHKGQMEFYLRYLEKYEKRPSENPPLGLILCSEKSKEVVELMSLDEGPIRVAQYWTRLIPKKLLQKKFRHVVKEAKEEVIKREERASDPKEEMEKILEESKSLPANGKTRPGDLTELQRQILTVCSEWKSRREIGTELAIPLGARFSRDLKNLLSRSLLRYLYPDHPRHRSQKYRRGG